MGSALPLFFAKFILLSGSRYVGKNPPRAASTPLKGLTIVGTIGKGRKSHQSLSPGTRVFKSSESALETIRWNVKVTLSHMS